jgi:plasmid stabilization system protein ParE
VKLIYHAKALKDLEEIVEFVALYHSTKRARTIYASILRSIRLLSNHELIGNYVHNSAKVRKKVINRTYTVYYGIDNDEKEIIIYRIWHNSRNPEDLDI